MKPRNIDENPFADLNLNLLQRKVHDIHLSWTSFPLPRNWGLVFLRLNIAMERSFTVKTVDGLFCTFFLTEYSILLYHIKLKKREPSPLYVDRWFREIRNNYKIFKTIKLFGELGCLYSKIGGKAEVAIL